MRWWAWLLVMGYASAWAQQPAFVDLLHERYPRFQEYHPRPNLRPVELQQLVERVRQGGNHRVRKLGLSVQKRPIYAIQLGNGPTRVLVWSQMHGNEPTATLALFDLINWFDKDTVAARVKKLVAEQLTIVLVPMLNPDGSETQSRFNALGIDLNRDATSLTSPESRILAALHDSLQPHFAFDLHDQTPYYGNPQTQRPAAISFLAAYANQLKTNSHQRQRSMQLIAEMLETAQLFVPGAVTRYDDSFIPGAFDEWCSRHGSSAILIESGAYYDDPERRYIRRVNFLLLADALRSIATQSYLQHSHTAYQQLPVSELMGFDLVVRQATFRHENREYLLDIGIRHHEYYDPTRRQAYKQFYIAEKGDLSYSFAFREIHADGLMLYEGKTYPQRVPDVNSLMSLKLDSLIDLGYTNFSVLQKIPATLSNHYPVNIVEEQIPVVFPLALRSEPNFVLSKNGKVVSVVINGIYRTVR